MKKLLVLAIAFFSITTITSCHKDKLDPDLPVSWKHSPTAPTGCSEPAPGSATYYVIFQQHKYSFPQMHSVWMAGNLPVIIDGQMLFGASTTIAFGVDPWNQVVNYFANHPECDYVVISHFIDGGPTNENWEFITNW